MPHVSIIGGGIAGLSAAWYLQQHAEATSQDLAYTLFEADDRVGGKILSRRQDGFVIEAGPDSFLTQKAWGQRLCRDIGLEPELVPMASRPVYVMKGQELVRFPAGFRLAVPTKWWPLITTPLFSPLGKLRLAMEPIIPTRRDTGDESLADFVRRRLGSEALAMIGEPLMASIHSADPETLSMATAFPMLQEMERKHGSLMKAFRQQTRRSPGASTVMTHAPTVPFMSLRDGMSQLADGIRARLSGSIRTGTPLARITRQGGRFRLHPREGETRDTDIIILATPAYAAAELLADLLPDLSAMLRDVQYSATATISLAYRRDDLPADRFDGLGFVTAASYPGELRACTVASQKFPHRAPDDQILLRGFFGGHGHRDSLDKSDDDLAAIAQRELHQVLGIDAQPLHWHLFRWPQATPQYQVGHLDRVDSMEAIAATVPGLYLTGSSYRGVGIPHCIGHAHATVDRIAADYHWAPAGDGGRK